MQHTITTIYCLCDDFLNAMNYHDDPQAKLSSAEAMTVPLVASCFFGGNVNRARLFLLEHGYLTRSVSESRLNRRLHRLPLELWHALFRLLGEVFKQCNPTSDYIVDSLPIPSCDNIRIRRCHLFAGPDKEDFRGHIASKRRYFFGLRVHLLITGRGEPVEFVLAPGADADVDVFKRFTLDLPSGSVIHADKGYTDYHEEDLLQEAGGIRLLAQRKRNTKRPRPLWEEFLSHPIRKRIETTFSRLTNWFPHRIHAITRRGFHLKVICFLVAFSIDCLNR
jgi:hypothetical protein